MSEVWVTNPVLGSDHDQKVLRESLGSYAARGYAEREDQSDPVPAEVAEALAAETHHHDVVDHDGEHKTPAEDVAPVSNDDDPEES